MDNSKYLDVFIDESAEHLDTMYEQLLLLEKNPQEKTIIEEIFRAAHTIKGMSATMGYEDLASLTHHIENIFDGIRYDTISVNTPLIDSLFDSLDQLNLIVEDISSGGTGKKDVAAIVQRLERLEKGEVLDDSANGQQVEIEAVSRSTQYFQLDEFQKTILEESKERAYNNFEIHVKLNESCLLKAARAYMVFEILEGHGEVVVSNPTVNDLEDENFDRSFTVLFVSKYEAKELQAKVMKVSEIETVTITPFSIKDYDIALQSAEAAREEASATKTEDQQESAQTSQTTQTAQSSQSRTIRVNMERLDMLMNLFEELVIDRGRLEQISLDLNHGELRETVEKMTRVSSDLQHIILQMRMVAIDTVFSRFPRMIRQLARDLNKEVDLEIIGSDTELDRTVIDEIGDPLVHLIRNAIDHGLEETEERVKRGKRSQGKIRLEAYHSGDHVFIEISDDGAGINKDAVLKKAISRQIISQADAELLEEEDILKLILESGFSTNEEISDISGRGVGLDVVKNTIESLGGSLSIRSVEGEGTTFSIQLPLTLTIISVLLVELGKEKYGIPLSSIVETAILPKSEILNAHHNKVIDFRDSVVPLIFLSDIFDCDYDVDETDEYVSIVIVRRGNNLTGIVVDSFIGQQEVVLKSLGNYLDNIFAISGATILGDGEVALIIDSNALIK